MSNEKESFDDYFKKTWCTSGDISNFDTTIERGVWNYCKEIEKKKLKEKDKRIKELEESLTCIYSASKQVENNRDYLLKQNAELREEFKRARIFLANAVDKSVLEFINQGKRMDKTLAKIEKGEK